MGGTLGCVLRGTQHMEGFLQQAFKSWAKLSRALWVAASSLAWIYALERRKSKGKKLSGGRTVIRSVCNAGVEWLFLHILTAFPSPSLGCIPCVPSACTITCWLTSLERFLTWFTWRSWVCEGTRWWFASSATWPTTPRAFRNWQDAQLKLAMFPTLPVISQRI